MTDQLDPKYLEAYDGFVKQATRLHEKNNEARARIRRDVDLTSDEREERYMAAHAAINQEFESLANAHALAVVQERRELEEKIYSGSGDKFSEHLTALAGVPDDRLAGLMATARRTGQKDLERAIAQTAHERAPYGPVFKEWAESDPERAEALQRLGRLPDDDRLRTRTLALRPFRLEALEPTPEDLERAQQIKSAREAQKDEFFGRGPRRQVGSRVS